MASPAASAQGVGAEPGAALLQKGLAHKAGSYGAPDYEAAYVQFLDAADAGVAAGYAEAAALKEAGLVTSGETAQDNLDAAYLYSAGAEAGCFPCMLGGAHV